MTKKVSVISSKLNLSAVLSIPSQKGKLPAVMFLHGGGNSGKGRYLEWQKYLSRHGLVSIAFDFRGVGDSEGDFGDGSLSNRLEDAMNIYRYIEKLESVDSNKIIVVGSSMGAHVACRLVDKKPNTKILILTSGAAYSENAENLKLDNTFSDEIRRKDSWKKSPAFYSVKNFSGKVLIVYGENDKVIPEGVKLSYKKTLKRGDKFIELKLASHTLLNPQNDIERNNYKDLIKTSTRFIIQNLQDN